MKFTKRLRASIIARTRFIEDLVIEESKKKDYSIHYYWNNNARIAKKGARAAGTPMISFFNQDEILSLAVNTGFKSVKTISTKDME